MTTTTASLASPARRRLRHRVPAVAVVAVAALAALAAIVLPAQPDAPGRVAPAFSLDDVRAPGTPVSLAQRGGGPAVVNFFAAWCVPCRKELPILERAHRRAGRHVAFLGVDVADSRRAATELLERTGVTYPAGYDPHKEVAGRYRLLGMPTTVFIGADGRIAGEVKGPLSAAELDRWIERLRGAG